MFESSLQVVTEKEGFRKIQSSKYNCWHSKTNDKKWKDRGQMRKSACYGCWKNVTKISISDISESEIKWKPWWKNLREVRMRQNLWPNEYGFNFLYGFLYFVDFVLEIFKNPW